MGFGWDDNVGCVHVSNWYQYKVLIKTLYDCGYRFNYDVSDYVHQFDDHSYWRQEYEVYPEVLIFAGRGVDVSGYNFYDGENYFNFYSFMDDIGHPVDGFVFDYYLPAHSLLGDWG